MAMKRMGQKSFADMLQLDHKSLEELDDIHELIDWNSIDVILSNIRTSTIGAPAWPSLLMFKALMLQSWYNLSDPQLEKQLARDLLFKRFVGLSVSDSVPDHSTLWRFRNLLEEKNLLTDILEEINDQLAAHGLFIRSGAASIIDASVVQAKNNRPKKGKNKENTQDPEASYNVKAGSDGKRKMTYGFKAHLNTDEDGLVKKASFTTGSEHDSQQFETLLTGTESEVYADSAYKSEKHDDLLKQRGVKNKILHRRYRNKPLTAAQKKMNRMYSSIRSIVERTIGVLKLHYGLAQARYMGLARNHARFLLCCIGHNIKRGEAIRSSI